MGLLFYRGRTAALERSGVKWGQVTQPGRSHPGSTTWGQGGVRAGEEEDHVGLSARVLMNGLGGPSDPQGYDPKGCRKHLCGWKCHLESRGQNSQSS